MAQEDWSTRKLWRPYMAWMYMAICMLDFAIFPILWSMLQAHFDGQVTSQWDPLTLKGAGLFHMAMGAVLGVAAYGRTQEKLNGATTYPQPTPVPTAYSVPTPISTTSSSIPKPTPIAGNATPTPPIMPEDPPERNTRND